MDSGSTTSYSGLGTAAATVSHSLDFRELDLLQQQAAQGKVDALRQFLGKNREGQDWQDRYFALDVVAPSIRPGSIDKLCAAEPSTVDLALIRGAHLLDMVAKARGTKTADRTTEAQMVQAEHYIKAALGSLRQAAQLDAADPTPHVFAMRCFQVFSDLQKHLQPAFQQAVRLAPDSVPAHFVMVNAKSKKWGGSHEEALQLARSVITHAKPGSDTGACLFLAHILVWQYAVLFDKDRKRGDAYLHDAQVGQELNHAFSRWIGGGYKPRRSSVPYLHHAAYWYFQAGDCTRLQQALGKTSGRSWDKAWAFAGDGPKTYASALEFAKTGKKSTPQERKGGLFGWLK